MLINPTINLNELISLAISSLETENLETKMDLLRTLRSLVRVIDVDFVHIFKANVVIELLIDSIQAELDEIKHSMSRAA